jgi:hypothetical protein
MKLQLLSEEIDNKIVKQIYDLTIMGMNENDDDYKHEQINDELVKLKEQYTEEFEEAMRQIDKNNASKPGYTNYLKRQKHRGNNNLIVWMLGELSRRAKQ